MAEDFGGSFWRRKSRPDALYVVAYHRANHVTMINITSGKRSGDGFEYEGGGSEKGVQLYELEEHFDGFELIAKDWRDL